MNLIHTYHPTSDGSRGLHAFTTAEDADALAILAVDALRRAMTDLTAWSGVVCESIEQTHGAGGVAAAIRDAFAKAEMALSLADGGARHG
jgi:hypothetical protein